VAIGARSRIDVVANRNTLMATSRSANEIARKIIRGWSLRCPNLPNDRYLRWLRSRANSSSHPRTPAEEPDLRDRSGRDRARLSGAPNPAPRDVARSKCSCSPENVNPTESPSMHKRYCRGRPLAGKLSIPHIVENPRCGGPSPSTLLVMESCPARRSRRHSESPICAAHESRRDHLQMHTARSSTRSSTE